MRPDTMRPDMPCLLKLCTLGFDRHEPLRCGDHDGVVVRRILPDVSRVSTASFLCTLGIGACSQSKK